MELKPEPLNKLPWAFWALIYCPPFLGVWSPGPPGLYRSLLAPHEILSSPLPQGKHSQPTHLKEPGKLYVFFLTCPHLLSGWTK